MIGNQGLVRGVAFLGGVLVAGLAFTAFNWWRTDDDDKKKEKEERSPVADVHHQGTQTDLESDEKKTETHEVGHFSSSSSTSSSVADGTHRDTQQESIPVEHLLTSYTSSSSQESSIRNGKFSDGCVSSSMSSSDEVDILCVPTASSQFNNSNTEELFSDGRYRRSGFWSVGSSMRTSLSSSLISQSSSPDEPEHEEEKTPSEEEDSHQFHERYEQTDRVLGQGGFGNVSIVMASREGNSLRVCKRTSFKAVMSWQNGWPLEVMIQGKLHHSNVTPLLEAFADIDEEQVLMILPFHAGAEDLGRWRSRRHGIIDGPVLNQVVNGMKNGLNFIHSRGIVHCDIKPSNVLMIPLTPGNPAGGYRIQILDFGVANHFSSEEQFRFLGGTPIYAGPEYGNQHLMSIMEGPEADVWSFGVLLWEIIYGRLPFKDREEINDLNLTRTPSTMALGSDLMLYQVSTVASLLMEGMLKKLPQQRLRLDQLPDDLDIPPSNTIVI